VKGIPPVILGLTLLVCLARSMAGDVSLTVIRAEGPPKIDGKLDDACWRGKARITDFRLVRPKGAKPTQRTAAWVAADEDALYVAVRCEDDRMDMVPAEVIGHDGHVWKDDCIEIFLMPHGPFYYHFGANLIGTRYDGRVDSRVSLRDQKPEAWDAVWRSVSQRAADHWTMEIAIPFACLEMGPEACDAPIRFNLGREQRRLTEFSCWPATGFHAYKEYAALDGLNLDKRRYGLVLGDVDTGRQAAGENRFTAVIAEEPAPGMAMTCRATVRHSAGARAEVTQETLRSAKGDKIGLAYSVPFDPGHATVVVECLDERGRVRTSVADVFRVPAVLEAELDLPIVYRSDEEARVTGSALLEKTLLGRAGCELRLMSDRRIVSTRQAPVDEETGAIRGSIPIAGLDPGRYVVEARLTVPDLREDPFVVRLHLRIVRGPLND